MRFVVWVLIALVYLGGVSGTMSHFASLGDCGPERRNRDCNSRVWIAAAVWPSQFGGEIARWSYQQIIERNQAKAAGKPS